VYYALMMTVVMIFVVEEFILYVILLHPFIILFRVSGTCILCDCFFLCCGCGWSRVSDILSWVVIMGLFPTFHGHGAWCTIGLYHKLGDKIC
jgi:hypothetical protein